MVIELYFIVFSQLLNRPDYFLHICHLQHPCLFFWLLKKKHIFASIIVPFLFIEPSSHKVIQLHHFLNPVVNVLINVFLYVMRKFCWHSLDVFCRSKNSLPQGCPLVCYCMQMIKHYFLEIGFYFLYTPHPNKHLLNIGLYLLFKP